MDGGPAARSACTSRRQHSTCTTSSPTSPASVSAARSATLAVLSYWQVHYEIPVLRGVPLDYGGLPDDRDCFARLGATFIASAGLDVLAARGQQQL